MAVLLTDKDLHTDSRKASSVMPLVTCTRHMAKMLERKGEEWVEESQKPLAH
jgi:hypothetical protein